VASREHGDGADLNAVTEPDDCVYCSIVSGDEMRQSSTALTVLIVTCFKMF